MKSVTVFSSNGFFFILCNTYRLDYVITLTVSIKSVALVFVTNLFKYFFFSINHVWVKEKC